MMTASPSALAHAYRFDARRKARKLGNTARRIRSPRHPVAIEAMMEQATRRLVSLYAKAVLPIALAGARKIGRTPPEERTDARQLTDKEAASAAKKVSSHMRAVARRAFQRGIPAYEARSKVAADRVRGHSQRELDRLGLKVKKEPEVKHLVDGWRKDNVAKVQGLADRQITRLEGILATGENRSIAALEGEIKNQLEDVSDSQAAYIARNQVVKLNAQINRHRAEAARSASYIWTTQGDDRVRDEHDALDGEEFEYDGPGDPEEGHPGEAPNCRCLAYPVPAANDDPEYAEDVEDTD
jgi:SPP1 gp7 family putative phage head morphogenesis protein